MTTKKNLKQLKKKPHPLVVKAKSEKLSYCWDRTTDGLPYFLLIGSEIGAFGIEAKDCAEFSDEELSSMFSETKNKLEKAGFEEKAKLHINLAAQY